MALTTDTGLCKLNPKIYQGCVLVFTIQTWKASIRRCLKASSITCCLAMRLLASFKYSSWWQHIRRKRHSAAGSINSMLKSPSTMFSNTNYQKKQNKKKLLLFYYTVHSYIGETLELLLIETVFLCLSVLMFFFSFLHNVYVSSNKITRKDKRWSEPYHHHLLSIVTLNYDKNNLLTRMKYLTRI